MKSGDRVVTADGQVGHVVQVYAVLARHRSWQVDAVSVQFTSRASAVMMAATDLTVLAD